MNTSVCLSVCLGVCLSVSISPKWRVRSLPIFCALVAHHCSSVFLLRGDAVPEGSGNFGFFFPIDNALYSIAFGTHTKTAEPIEMPYGLMTRVGPRYHVLDGGPNPPRGRDNLGVVWTIQKHWQSWNSCTNNKLNSIKPAIGETARSRPVSYTHLTLPTIYSV